MTPRNEPFRPEAPTVPELAAGAVVVSAVGNPVRILLLHLKEEERWCLPKGHVEAGESLGAAALREVREETGLDGVSLGAEIGVVSYRFYSPREQHNVYKTSIYFLARSPASTAHPEPIFDRYEWVAPERALGMFRYEEDRTIVESARRQLARAGA